MDLKIMLIFFTAIISGFSIFINSIGVKEFDSSVFTFLKNLLVAALLFAIIIGIGSLSELRKLSRKNWTRLIIIGLVGGSIPFLLYFKGLQMTTGATSGFIHKTMFLYVAVFALVFLKEKITKWVFAGAVMLLIGNYLLIKPDFNLSAGHALVLAAVIMWAIENTYSKHVLKEISGTVVAFGRMFFGCAFMLLFLLAAGKISLISSLKTAHLMWIVLTAVFLLLYVLTFYNGLRHVKVTTAASILSLGQPITMLLSFVFKGKQVTAYQTFGMLIILAGIALIVWFSEISSGMHAVTGAKDGRY